MTSIYVGNLPSTASENDLEQAFSQYGKVSDVKIVKDRETGQSRGFAFVEMPDGAQAAKAIEALNLSEIGGRSMTVNEAHPRPEKSRRGFRRGR